MKTLLASDMDNFIENTNEDEHDELFYLINDPDIEVIDDDGEMIHRHPSNKGSVITDGGTNIFVPDAKYRKKRISLDNDGFYNKYNSTLNCWNRCNINLQQFVNEVNNLSTATQKNNRILEFNNMIETEGIYGTGITCFDVCNSIVVPKVGKCVIPTYQQLETIFEFRHDLDALDKSPYNHQSKLFKNWFNSTWRGYFISCDLILSSYYNAEDMLKIIYVRTYSDYDIHRDETIINDRNMCLLPIIEL